MSQPSVLERLRVALAPGIVVERELARGGMGIVLLGHDTVLDRPVAIKTLVPERTTAVLAERFVREARSTASLVHPNVVTVHDANVADGLPYYVMDYFPGGTLKTRLARGRLTSYQVVRLGRDLLAALAAAHRSHIVHRDVKPGNIFLHQGHARLADFGIAYVIDSTETALTATGELVGTPGYMAPEQLRDTRVTGSADLYSVGLVLLEACAGERWNQLDPLETSRAWARVPPQLREPIRRALAPDPRDRWSDAERFSEALGAAGRRAGRADFVRRARVGLGLAGLCVAVGAGWYLSGGRESTDTSVTVFPFDPAVLTDSALGTEVSGFAAFYLERMPRLVVTHFPAAARAWHASALPPGARLAHLTSTRLRTDYGVRGVIRRAGASLEVQVQVVGTGGAPVADMTVRGDSADRWALGDSIGAEFVRTALGRRADFPKVPAEVSPAAWPMFFEGELAFARGAWLQAERHYAAALSADTAFVLAAWRLGNVRRWLAIESAYPPGFVDLYRSRGHTLLHADRRLIEAQLAPTAGERFARYEEAVNSAGGDAYAALFYGDELFHRGPLAGRPLADAVAMLRRALAADSSFAPAWEHLAWALIRLGERGAAETALVHLDRVAGPREEYRLYLPPLLDLAYAMRFGQRASGRADTLMRSPDVLALAARGALAFDIPGVELMLGGTLAGSAAPPALRASGRVAEGLALIALGRPIEAVGRFDAAARLSAHGSEERLHAAQWRVIPSAIGFPGLGPRQSEEGRRALATLAEDPVVGHRASWALALDALARGDTAASGMWRERIVRSSAAEGLMPLLDALALASTGELERAVTVVTSAAAHDSAGRAPDPFLRSAVHLVRGEWLRRLGRHEAAGRDWLWHENTDVRGWPDAEVQAAEVDWALSTFARWRRAELASASGDKAAACALASRVAEIWSRPEPALDSLARAAARRARECRS